MATLCQSNNNENVFESLNHSEDVMILQRALPYILACIVLIIFIGVSGCSTFSSSKRIDMGPFSENTMSLLSEVEFGQPQKETIYIRPYLTGEAVVKIRMQIGSIQKLFRGIVFYSGQVVAINQSQLSENEKAKQLARYIDEIARPIIGKGGSVFTINESQLDTILMDIRKQTNYLDALGAAQPIVDDILRYSNALFEQYKTIESEAVVEVSGKIDSTFGGVRQNFRNIELLQQRSMHSYTLLYQYKLGAESSLDSLRTNDHALDRYLGKSGTVTLRNLDSAEQHLARRLAQIKEMRDQIMPEMTYFMETKSALDTRVSQLQETLKKARIAITTWARSHRNLAAGIEVPPQVDIFGTAVSALRGATGVVLP